MRVKKRSTRAFLASAAALIGAASYLALAQSNAAPAPASKEWPTYGHDAGGMRFSPLTQVTPSNVAQLKVAWVYHMKPATPAVAPAVAPPAGGRGRGGSGFSGSEMTPIVANGTMYLSTPYGRVVALEPTTGK